MKDGRRQAGGPAQRFDGTWQGIPYITLSDGIFLDQVTLKTSLDRDSDSIHDWVDGCMPGSTIDETIESPEGRSKACLATQAITESSGGGGGGSAHWLPSLIRRKPKAYQRKKTDYVCAAARLMAKESPPLPSNHALSTSPSYISGAGTALPQTLSTPERLGL